MNTNKKLDEDLLMAFPGGTDTIKSFSKLIRVVPENVLHIYPLDHPRWDKNTHFGVDAFNFDALPAGYRHTDGTYLYIGQRLIMRSSETLKARHIQYSSDVFSTSLAGGSFNDKAGFSIRLIRLAVGDEVNYVDGTVINNAFTDYDGNVYSGCKIGTQIWTRENFKVTHLSNGTIIPTGYDNTTWSALTTLAYATPQYNGYGLLYNFYAINGLINDINWHIPTDSEFTTLSTYIESLPAWDNTNVGKALKSTRQLS